MSRFDEVINRKDTNSLKHDFTRERGKPEDILPLWVADMDFRAPEEVIDALKHAVEHGIFGYSVPKQEYYDAVLSWFLTQFAWEAKREWMVKTPGVVYAISAAVRAFTKEQESVLIQQPVYYPFANVVRESERTLVNNELRYHNGQYEMDLEDFERKIIENNVKLFILCSPHNPVGRVWTKEELQKVSELCLKHQVLIISDEIHCDFTYEGHPHHILASISEEVADHCIICTAPSKSFNLAGLQISNIFIKNPELRKAFKRAVYLTGYDEINTLGLIACKAAYEKGEPWLLELKEYLQGNVEMIREFLKNRIPQIKMIEPQGTYLLWLDCSKLGLTDDELESLMVTKAKLWLDAGSMFGERSGQFERINLTSPRSVLKKAMEQLEEAVKELVGANK